jgi:hypothetical protein
LTARRALDIYPGHDEIIEEYARLTQDYAEGFVPNAPPSVQ